MQATQADEKDAVKIRCAKVESDSGDPVPYMYTVHQNGFQLGFFLVGDYGNPDGARAAATALADELKAHPWISPFVTHEQTILADYGTATKLRRIVLSLYNGHAFPCDLSDISGMDEHHLQIVFDLMKSYHTLGENDKDMLKLAEHIKKKFHIKPNGED